MTRQFIRCLLAIMVVPIILAVAASPAQAETNKHYEACQTLGGEYEERRTDCDPECKTTYICRFKEGWSRVCDDQGVCNQVQDGSSGNTPNSAESSQQNRPQAAIAKPGALPGFLPPTLTKNGKGKKHAVIFPL
jgi:hypothetical protein